VRDFGYLTAVILYSPPPFVDEDLNYSPNLNLRAIPHIIKYAIDEQWIRLHLNFTV